MSRNVNVAGMDYAQKADVERRCKNRLLKVREQSKEIAQDVRNKVKIARGQQLKKLQQIKEKELCEWKRRNQNDIQKQIDRSVKNFANAHIAAIDASCEEDEALCQKREENDLMAAVRGRVAMLQEQRKREKEAEERLLKRKRLQQKTIGIQADFLTNCAFSENLKQPQHAPSSDEESNGAYVTRPNLHKHSTTSNVAAKQNYNAQNYTSNSVDSNNGESDSNEDLTISEESQQEMEFNQITNLLKQNMYRAYEKTNAESECEKVIEIDSESSDIEVVPQVKSKVSKKIVPKKKSILKKSPTKSAKAKSNKIASPVKKPTTTQNRVRYIDYGNKYETSYIPSENLITRNSQPSVTNAKEEANKIKEDLISKRINEDILKQLADIRSQEALEKEKIRRDYELLRNELDELSKQEQEMKAKSNMHKNLSKNQMLQKEKIKQQKMNEAAENAMRKNIISCPPVATREKASPSNELNVAMPFSSQQSDKDTGKKHNEEISNLIKIERLKDVLEQINHQKRILMKEIEKNEDIPGPDLEKVLESLKKLEKEKADLNCNQNIDGTTEKKIEEILERERKVSEREKQLEEKLREMFKNQQQKITSSSQASVSKSSTETSSEINPPVEIIIKVQQQKTPTRKRKKSFRCVDTLNREPSKVYPKTPIRRKKSEEMLQNIEKAHQKTQTSSIESNSSPKPILKKPQDKKRDSVTDDSSASTAYLSLPDKIYTRDTASRANLQPVKPGHKLNPVLLQYITRLLGMNTRIVNQLNVTVSDIATPGSSTINTTGNNSVSTGEPVFSDERFERLQKFIDDNYSLLSEVNDTLERVQMEQQNVENVDGIWRDVLRAKKPINNIPKKDGKPPEKLTPPSRVQSNQKISSQTSRPVSNQSEKTNKIATSQQHLQRTATLKETERRPAPQTRPNDRPEISNQDMQNVTKYLESHMLNNYSEYTANCQKRIADLTKMMERVRQEKLKLIENSLSSGEYNNFTEYKEIVIEAKRKESDQKDSPSQREDPPSEEINNILQRQTRPFGVSKDSGISMSRPVTSSDIRDSPDVRVTSEEKENVFQPISKEGAKLPRLKITNDGEQKKLKPPLSLKSFSPQIEKQHEPHELSTIAEIETPSASKVNLVPDDIQGMSGLHSFPHFEEYAKQLGLSNVDHSTTAPFPDMSDLKNALPDIRIQTFAAPSEYEISKVNDDLGSNESSLMDIEEELKKRNFYKKPSDTKEDTTTDKTTPVTATQQNIAPNSPRKRAAKSRIIINTPDNPGLQLEVIHTPTKKKASLPAEQIPQPESLKSNDTLSGIQEIENDLQDGGMNWAANMLKRNKANETSSSSGQKSIQIEIEIPSSSSSSPTNGKPLNLKEFLRRELLTTMNNKKNDKKQTSDDSSLSSQFMKSLLNMTSNSSSKSENSSQNGDSKRLRTSTPVQTRPSVEQLVAKSTVNSQLFVGESFSTLKDSGSSQAS